MPAEVPGSASGTTAGIVKSFCATPSAVMKGAAVFTLAHSLGLLGLTGVGLACLGLYDAVRAHRERKRAWGAVPPAANRSEKKG